MIVLPCVEMITKWYLINKFIYSISIELDKNDVGNVKRLTIDLHAIFASIVLDHQKENNSSKTLFST